MNSDDERAYTALHEEDPQGEERKPFHYMAIEIESDIALQALVDVFNYTGIKYRRVVIDQVDFSEVETLR